MTAVGFAVSEVNNQQAEYAFNFVRRLLHDPACLSTFSDGAYGAEGAGAGLLVLGHTPVVKSIPLTDRVSDSNEAELFALLCGIYSMRASLRQRRPDGRLYASVGIFADSINVLEGIAGHPTWQSERGVKLTSICRRELLTLAREAGVHVFLAWAPKAKSPGIEEAHNAANRAKVRAAAARKDGPRGPRG